jgi:signal transduction histidine kinase
MRVLAVDDDAVARIAIRGMITTLGHECLLAVNGDQAWQLLQSEEVDVVITDRIMPDLDGLELCRRIRAAGSEAGTEGKYLYVVLASALGEDEQARDGMLAGADDYLAKPLRAAQLERKLIAAERVTSLQRKVAGANTALARANELQADMLALLAHDARQPLTAILGYSEALVDDWETTPDQLKCSLVAKTNDAARRLNQLIEDVLTMANLDSGTISCRTEPLGLETIIDEVIAAGHESVDVTLDPEVRALVDPWHFRQILANLVGNAVKYGAPPFRVTVLADAEQVEVQVSDRGEGVPADFVPHLFERFKRAETGIATLKAGTGFGLYIVRALAEVNGGDVTYRPEPDGGSCFTLSLARA